MGERAEATIRTANRVLLSVGGTAAEMRDTAKKQKVLLEQTTRLTNERLDQFGTVLTKLDARVNDELLPMLTRAVKKNSEASETLLYETVFAMRQVSMDVHEATYELNTTAQETQEVIKQANKVLSDPAITSSIKNVDGATLHLKGTMANVENMTKPAKMWFKAGQWLWDKVWQGFAAW